MGCLKRLDEVEQERQDDPRTDYHDDPLQQAMLDEGRKRDERERGIASGMLMIQDSGRPSCNSGILNDHIQSS